MASAAAILSKLGAALVEDPAALLGGFSVAAGLLWLLAAWMIYRVATRA